MINQVKEFCYKKDLPGEHFNPKPVVAGHVCRTKACVTKPKMILSASIHTKDNKDLLHTLKHWQLHVSSGKYEERHSHKRSLVCELLTRMKCSSLTRTACGKASKVRHRKASVQLLYSWRPINDNQASTAPTSADNFPFFSAPVFLGSSFMEELSTSLFVYEQLLELKTS